jgi:hypothetical protein
MMFDQPTTCGCAPRELRHRGSAGWLAALLRPLPAGMPRRCILEMSVVLDSPSLAAAPSQPPSTQFVACKVATICSRSTCASVRDAAAGTVDAARRVRQSQHLARRRHDSSLDHVLKLPNVPWPRIVLQAGNHLVRDFLDLLALTLGEMADEVSDEERDVLGAFAQRGSWSARSSLGCSSSGRSPTSSRNNVPRSAV